MTLQEVVKAQTLDHALTLIADPGAQAMLIAGGTDLITQLRGERINPLLLVDISGLPELQFIKDDGDYLEMGAAINFSAIAKHPLISQWAPGLMVAARGVGSPQIRNRGTIGGNICNGSPAADTVPPLLALDAIVTFHSRKGQRKSALAQIHKDKGQIDIRPDEILTSIRFPKVKHHQGLGFSKLGLRKALAISTISLSAFIGFDDQRYCQQIRVASGSLGRFPQREPEVEKLLVGQILTNQLIAEVARQFGDLLRTRLQGRPPVEIEYKPEAIKGVFKAAINQAMIGAETLKGGEI